MTGYYIFISIILCAYLLNCNSKIILLCIMIFSVFREGVGWDYYSYLEIVDCKIKGIIINDYNRFTLPWKLLIDFAAKLNSPKLIIIVPAILTHLFIYFGLKRVYKNNDNKISVTLLFYIFIPVFYLASFSTIRQWLAISIIFYGITFLNENNIKTFIFFLFIACFIHSSAILGILFILIKYKSWTSQSIIIYFIIAVIVSFFILEIMQKLYFFFEIHNQYIMEPDNKGKKILLVFLLFAISLLFLRNKISIDKQMTLYNDSFIWGVILLLATYPFGGVISRSFYYFLIPLLYIIPTTKNYFTKRSIPIVNFGLISFVIFIFIFYLYHIKNVSSYNAGFVPYKFSYKLF